MGTVTELIGHVGVEPDVNKQLSFEDCDVEDLRKMSDTFREKETYGDSYYTPPRASILVHQDTPKVDTEQLIKAIEDL